MDAQADLEDKDASMSFWAHIGELRRRLLICALTLLAGFFVGWGFREDLYALATAPIMEGLAVHGIRRLVAIETTEAMVVYLQLALAAAVFLTVPVALYELWGFVKPALRPVEIRPMRRIAVMSLFMFAAGLIFCYRFVLPLVIDYLAAFTLAAPGIDFQVTMRSAYLTAILFLIGFGLIFELPLAMVLLAATPLMDWRKYVRWFRHYIVVAFIVAAILTPPDVLSQLLMAVPMVVLYVVGIVLTWFMQRKRERTAGDTPRTGFDFPLSLAALVASAACVLPFWSWQGPAAPDFRFELVLAPAGSAAAPSLTVTVPRLASGRVEVDLSFSATEEAEAFAEWVNAGEARGPAPVAAAPRNHELRAAVGLLADAVEDLARARTVVESPARTEQAASAAERVAQTISRARVLATAASSPLSVLRDCASPWCAHAVLAPFLPEPDEVTVRQRTVVMAYECDGEISERLVGTLSE